MKYFSALLLFGTLTLTSCNFAKNGGTAAEGDSILDSTQVAASVADTVVPDLEAVKVFKPRIQKINKEIYYKASTKQKIYTTAHFDLQWPAEAEGYDITPLQSAINEWLFTDGSTNINAIIRRAGLEWFKNCGGDEVKWTEVAKREKSDDDGDSSGDEIHFWGEPEYSVKLTFDGVDNDRHIAQFTLVFYGYNGGGTAAGILAADKELYYLYDEQRVMTVDDIADAKGQRALLRKLNNNPINIDRYDCLNGEEIKELPDNFRIEKGVIYFIFPKYLIACGADGNVMLGVRLSSISDNLTNLGRTYLK